MYGVGGSRSGCGRRSHRHGPRGAEGDGDPPGSAALYLARHVQVPELRSRGGIPVAGHDRKRHSRSLREPSGRDPEARRRVPDLRRAEGGGYLKSIEIIKKYPDELTIKIKEREPVLALPEKTNSNSLRRKKKYYLMAEDGVILEKSSPRKNLTEISKSLINDDQKIGRYIGLKDKIERKELLDILSSMKNGNIFYKKIDLDKGNLIAYVNDKLVIKGEIKAVVKAAKSKKLSKILFDLYKKKKMEGTIILSDNEYSVYSPQTYKEVKVKE